MIEERYVRNVGEYFSLEDQSKIFQTTVGIIGVGGVGGEIALLLARLGIKKLIIYDGDIFTESNLNRQTFCTLSTLGKNKALVTKEYIQTEINPKTIIDAYPQFYGYDNNDFNIMQQADIIFHEADSFVNFFQLMQSIRKLMTEANKIVISSSLEYIGVSTIVFSKDSLDHFDRIIKDTPTLLEMEQDKENFNHSIGQLGHLTSLAASQGVDAFVKIICNKAYIPKDLRLLYNIYDNTLYHIRYREDEELLYDIYKRTLPNLMNYDDREDVEENVPFE